MPSELAAFAKEQEERKEDKDGEEKDDREAKSQKKQPELDVRDETKDESFLAIAKRKEEQARDENVDGVWNDIFDGGPRRRSRKKRPNHKAAAKGGRMRVGDIVEANWRKEELWFKAKIVRENSNKTYDVKYDDGECEKGKARTELRPWKDPNPPPKKGDTVEARSKTKEGWHGQGDKRKGVHLTASWPRCCSS